MPYVNKKYLEIFGRRPETRANKYHAYLLEGIRSKTNPLIKIKEDAFLGSDEFAKAMKKSFMKRNS